MHNHLSWMDGVSIGSIVGAISGAMPTFLTIMATALAVVWYSTQIYLFILDRLALRRARKGNP